MIKIRKEGSSKDDFLFYQKVGERIQNIFPDAINLKVHRSQDGVFILDLTWPPGVSVLLVPRRLKTVRRFVSERPGRELFLLGDLLYNKMGLKRSQIDTSYEMIHGGKWAIISIYG
ncbi:hypothetical protein [Curionopolis virus]|uniref:Uncharacterized protein n=2 Tax=Curionopolis virus TaxID=490110 RepID=A0A0D3R141_9RHAB|nr:hypothetical protein [Curionopolis virus]AIE12118.1 pAG3 protein [Curionopolis virus]AJR28368.1 hypothetical protein [Curionopolis virus]